MSLLNKSLLSEYYFEEFGVLKIKWIRNSAFIELALPGRKLFWLAVIWLLFGPGFNQTLVMRQAQPEV